ncbi:MAG: SDR family oxidoreductase [Pseudomonadota bacterium]
MSPLENRVAVITGGASGIGAATARVLASQGATVVIADINADAARTVAADVGGHAFTLDVRDADAIEAFADWVESDIGPTRIVVTSAGLVQAPLPPEDFPLDLFDNINAVNQRGTWLTLRAFARHMLPRHAGEMVTISSIVAERSVPLHAYAPGKAAVLNMTQCLAAEWGMAGLRVNTVQPGYTRTPALQAQIDAGNRDPGLLEANSTLGRMVEPEEIGAAIAFLVSDQAAAITGVALPVDAGYFCAGSWHPYGGVRPRN